jgi:hypothetical protein
MSLVILPPFTPPSLYTSIHIHTNSRYGLSLLQRYYFRHCLSRSFFPDIDAYFPLEEDILPWII